MKNERLKIKIIASALCVLFVFEGHCFARSDSWKSGKLFSQAKKDIRNGLYLTAYDKLSEAYWLDPFNEKALKEMEKITNNFKKHISVWGEYDFEQKAYAAGFLYYTQGDYGNALKEWEKILTVKENTEVRGYLEFFSAELKKGTKKEELSYGGKAKKDREAAAAKKVEKKKIKEKAAPAKKPEPKKVPEETPTAKIDKEKAEELYNEGLRQYSQGYLKNAVVSWEKTLKYNPGHDRAKRALKKARKMLDAK